MLTGRRRAGPAMAEFCLGGRATRREAGPEGGREPEGSGFPALGAVEEADAPDSVRSPQTALEVAGTSAASFFTLPSTDVSQTGGALPRLTPRLASEEERPSGIAAPPENPSVQAEFKLSPPARRA